MNKSPVVDEVMEIDSLLDESTYWFTSYPNIKDLSLSIKDQNDMMLTEGVDYTCDYSKGLMIFHFPGEVKEKYTLPFVVQYKRYLYESIF